MDCKDKLLSVLFEGAMQVATVWINGKFVMQHQEGYLPFTIGKLIKKQKPDNGPDSPYGD